MQWWQAYFMRIIPGLSPAEAVWPLKAAKRERKNGSNDTHFAGGAVAAYHTLFK